MKAITATTITARIVRRSLQVGSIAINNADFIIRTVHRSCVALIDVVFSAHIGTPRDDANDLRIRMSTIAAPVSRNDGAVVAASDRAGI
jgi:hypothetical protein